MTASPPPAPLPRQRRASATPSPPTSGWPARRAARSGDHGALPCGSQRWKTLGSIRSWPFCFPSPFCPLFFPYQPFSQPSGPAADHSPAGRPTGSPVPLFFFQQKQRFSSSFGPAQRPTNGLPRAGASTRACGAQRPICGPSVFFPAAVFLFLCCRNFQTAISFEP